MRLSIRKSILYFSLSVVLLVVGGYFGSFVVHPPVLLSKQETSYTFNSKLWRIFDLGLHVAWADVLWIQTLLESDLDHYKKNDLNSWLYLRFLAISELDPLFYENYQIGSQYLMVIKNDLEGANELLEKGLYYYPNDVSLNWHMGFLWIFERKNPKKGYPFFEKVSQSPNKPPLFDSIFTKLKAQTYGALEAYLFALESWKQQPDESPIKRRLALELYSLKAEIDLGCLKNNGTTCDRIDFEGKPYINEKGVWKTSKPLIKTHLYFRNDKEN